MSTNSCRICDKRAYARNLCRMHYERLRRYGGPGPTNMIGHRAPFTDRLLNSIQIYGGLPADPTLGQCSVWTGYRHKSGFGAIWSGHRLLYVHRVAWEQIHGPIPVNAIVTHLCKNRLCVREEHLSLMRRSGPGAAMTPYRQIGSS